MSSKRRKTVNNDQMPSMLLSDLPEECIGSITWYLVNNAHDYAKLAATCSRLRSAVWSGVDVLRTKLTYAPKYPGVFEVNDKREAGISWSSLLSISGRPLRSLRCLVLSMTPNEQKRFVPMEERNLANFPALQKVKILSRSAPDDLVNFLSALPALQVIVCPANLAARLSTGFTKLKKLTIMGELARDIVNPNWPALEKLKTKGVLRTKETVTIQGIGALTNLEYLDLSIVPSSGATGAQPGYWTMEELERIISKLPKLQFLRIPSSSSYSENNLGQPHEAWIDFVLSVLDALHDLCVPERLGRLLANCSVEVAAGSLLSTLSLLSARSGLGYTTQDNMLMNLVKCPFFDIRHIFSSKVSKQMHIDRRSAINRPLGLYNTKTLHKALLQREQEMGQILTSGEYDHEALCTLVLSSFDDEVLKDYLRMGFDPGYMPSCGWDNKLLPIVENLLESIRGTQGTPFRILLDLSKKYFKIDWTDPNDATALATYISVAFRSSTPQFFGKRIANGEIPRPTVEFISSVLKETTRFFYMRDMYKIVDLASWTEESLQNLWLFFTPFIAGDDDENSSVVLERKRQIVSDFKDYCVEARKEYTSKNRELELSIVWCDRRLTVPDRPRRGKR